MSFNNDSSTPLRSWSCPPPSNFEFSSFTELNAVVYDAEIEKSLDSAHISDEHQLRMKKHELESNQSVEDNRPRPSPDTAVENVPPRDKAPNTKHNIELAHPHPKRPMQMVEIWNAQRSFEAMANGSDGCSGLGRPENSSANGSLTSSQRAKARRGKVTVTGPGPAAELDRLYPGLRHKAKAKAVGNRCFYPPGYYAPAPEPPAANPAPVHPPRSPVFKGSGRSNIFTVPRRAAEPAPAPPRVPPRRFPRSDHSSSPEATYVRGHHIARLFRQYGDIFVERGDAAPVSPTGRSDSSWLDDEAGDSDPDDFMAIGDRSDSSYYDESMTVDLSELSLNPAHKESYFADEESNLSDSPCISPVFPRTASLSSIPESFIFNGPTVRLVPPSNVIWPELPDIQPISNSPSGFFWDPEAEARAMSPVRVVNDADDTWRLKYHPRRNLGGNLSKPLAERSI